MRTTVNINDQLLSAVRKRAADEHATLTEIFDRALRQYVAQAPPRKFKLHWKAHAGGKIQPGAVLEDRDVLFDLMERRREDVVALLNVDRTTL